MNGMDLLWLIPALPFTGFLVLAVCGSRLSARAVAAIGAGSIGLSALVAVFTAVRFFLSPPPGSVFVQTLWTWMNAGGFKPLISLYLDPLSLVMVLVVTVVGFLIHLYSVGFMAEEEGTSRFFATMNLFVGSMITLVLAGDLLLLYLGWEGVGLCSYLLIGFWYRDSDNIRAANKAFIVTRVGDAALAVGLLFLFVQLGTLDIQAATAKAAADWPAGSALPTAAAALLLAGAVGKSAQLPLQTWLPDAMAGPTPVSALIHAATMVTAGVYLIARTHVLFALAPSVQLAVAVIGAATVLLAGFSALVQRDIKRVLAYSTISQIGTMFLALGVGAWSAAIFHFMTHACFKALLFLAAGVVIRGLGEERDMLRMGGLRRDFPLAFGTFLIGAASLSALPLVTAGFYSKNLIIEISWLSRIGSPWLWAAAAVGSFLTALYAFRMVFLVFFGEARERAVSQQTGFSVRVPLIVLAILSLGIGFVDWPHLFTGFVEQALPAAKVETAGTAVGALLAFDRFLVAPLGILAAYLLFVRRPRYAEALTAARTGAALHRFWFSGWGFDALYDVLWVRPFVWFARTNRDDAVDLPVRGLAWTSEFFSGLLVLTESGKVRWYAAGVAFGALLTLGWVVFL